MISFQKCEEHITVVVLWFNDLKNWIHIVVKNIPYSQNIFEIRNKAVISGKCIYLAAVQYIVFEVYKLKISKADYLNTI